MAAGEVLLNGTQIGIEATNANVLANLLDANSITEWSTYPNNTAWAGMDAGAACLLTRVRISPMGGQEDYAIGGVIQGAASSGFGLVQYTQNWVNNSSIGSITTNFGNAQISGDTIVLCVDPDASGITIGVSDTKGNTYALAQ